MAIRTKGRANFHYNGRDFVWHVANDVLLRISSNDKQFSVAYELIGNNRLLWIIGPEFIGIPITVRRPVLIVPLISLRKSVVEQYANFGLVL